jgi:hypothetical protein
MSGVIAQVAVLTPAFQVFIAAIFGRVVEMRYCKNYACQTHYFGSLLTTVVLSQQIIIHVHFLL